ncbi:MAG: DUF1080 domain-containing protein [Candidatus Latescibacter sp.]|nr:DUF1080 domain-containing protein [Candidatus Latescibacter sp.]
MRSHISASLALFLVLSVPTVPVSAQSPGPGYLSLFNGRDFIGWDIEPNLGAWVVENSEISCLGKPATPYLIRSVKEYENFDFYADFKVSKNCNTGIFFHVQSAGRESRLGFEAQILDDSGKPADKTSTGSIYDVVAPTVNAMKPAGEWNRYRVLFDWPKCQIWLNGQLVQDTDFSAHPILKYRLRRGVIGLSNHGFPVQYRNIRIKELPDKEAWTSLFNGRNLQGWTAVGDADWQVKDGMLIATKGRGYLITDSEFDRFQFQALAENDTLRSRSGCFFYRWKSVDDPGYAVDFYDFPKAAVTTKQYRGNIPERVIPPWKYPWLLYQIISADRESEIRVGGYITTSNSLLGKVRPGKIAIYHSPEDGIIRFRQIRIQQLEGKGI